MFTKKIYLYSLLPLILLSVLAGCQMTTDVFEAQLVPRSAIESQDEIRQAIWPVLSAIHGYAERISLVQYVTTACTTADGFGGPPKCLGGEEDGTIVQAFPISDTEGYFLRPGEIAGAFEFTVEGLYAVYRPNTGVDPEEYWPTGEYALLFEREINNMSQPVIVFVDDGKIVRLAFSYGVDPETLLSQVSVENIVFSPAEAKALSEQVLKE